VNLSENQNGTMVISKMHSYEIGIQTSTSSNNRLYARVWTKADPFDAYSTTSTYTLSRNTWYHVVMTYKDGVGISLYVNGVLRSSSSASGIIQSGASMGPYLGQNTPEPLYIGWYSGFKGRIDEVRIYPKALSQQQISQRYGETRYGSSSTSVMTSPETAEGDTQMELLILRRSI
jgi:hypothetical protein